MEWAHEERELPVNNEESGRSFVRWREHVSTCRLAFDLCWEAKWRVKLCEGTCVESTSEGTSGRLLAHRTSQLKNNVMERQQWKRTPRHSPIHRQRATRHQRRSNLDSVSEQGEARSGRAGRALPCLDRMTHATPTRVRSSPRCAYGARPSRWHAGRG